MTLAIIEPPTWVMPTIALVGPILVVVITLLTQRNRS